MQKTNTKDIKKATSGSDLPKNLNNLNNFKENMSKKNKPTLTLEIDGKKYKSIKKIKDGDKIWTKFQPTEKEGVGLGIHIIHSKPEENHIDIYEYGKEVGKNRDFDVKPAGVVLLSNGKIETLPQLIFKEGELEGKTPLQIAEEYIKRIKIIDQDK